MNDSSIRIGKKEPCGKRETELDPVLEQELCKWMGAHDLETLAEETGALQRHRGIHSAVDLLRIVFGYSVLDHSLRMLGIWCTVIQIANVSKTALLKRLRHCRKWLGRLIVLALVQQKLTILPQRDRVRVKLLDASVICQPGSKGVDWRLHLSFDLNTVCLDEIEITDGKGAERLNRFTFHPGDIGIGDRAYAIAKSLGYILSQGAWVVVRTGWNRLAFENEAGQHFDLISWLKNKQWSPEGPTHEVQVWITTPQGRYAIRLVAALLPPISIEKAQRKVRQDAKKNHHSPDERSLYTAGYILLLTNLPQTDWSMDTVLQLYRFRWQIELAFKRLKSLIHLDLLRCKDPELAQVYLMGKLLAVILMERIQLGLEATHPSWFLQPNRPISFWRLNTLIWTELRMLIRGPLALEKIVEMFPLLLRYLCDEPRKRKQQLVTARRLFQGLCGPY
jgi:hypothetical protein